MQKRKPKIEQLIVAVVIATVCVITAASHVIPYWAKQARIKEIRESAAKEAALRDAKDQEQLRKSVKYFRSWYEQQSDEVKKQHLERLLYQESLVSGPR